MSLTIIQNAELPEVKKELQRMLTDGIRSPEVRAMAIEITQYADDSISAIHDWIKANIPYVSDPAKRELFIAPRRLLEMQQQGIAGGDCDDLALLSASMLSSIGYETRLALLDTGSGEFDHAIAQVKSENGWVNFDTSSILPLGWHISYSRAIYIEPQ